MSDIPEPIDADELAKIKTLVDDELRRRRPDRYEPGHEFLTEVAEWVAPQIPITMARAMLAKSLVGQQEGRATRRGNKFLKEIINPEGKHQLPLDWFLYSAEPVALLIPIEGDSGEMRRERVALRAMTPIDWRHFTQHGRVDAQHRFDAEMAMYAAADWLAEQQGDSTFEAWAEAICPRGEERVS